MSDLEVLLRMGYGEPESKAALEQTSGGVSAAIDLLGEITNKLPGQHGGKEPHDQASSAQENPENQPRSLVCNQCNKRFGSTAEAEFHASRTEHAGFSESTQEVIPLTEDEKSSRLKELRARAAIKKAAMNELDKIEQRRNEEIRRKNTKEASDAKLDLARKALLSEAAAQKREKQAAIEAKKAVKAKIAADKEERQRQIEHRSGPRSPQLAQLPTEATASKGAKSSEATESSSHARLKIQTPHGVLFHTLPVDTTLFEVARLVQAENGFSLQDFTVGFPRRRWLRAEFGVTLSEAGLVPSANLVVT